MKFKLTSGDSTISFEGELEEAKAILDAYWDPRPSNSSAKQTDNSANDNNGASKPARRKRKSAPNSPSQTPAASIDANALANKMKSSDLFPKIKSKITEKKSDWVNKCKLVAYFAEEPITSGDVHRTMTALKVKSRLDTLSRTLSNNSDLFLTAGGNPVKYELTSAAQNEFTAWLSLEGDE